MKRLFSLGQWTPRRNSPEKGQIIEGFGGVLVRPDFFDDDVFEVSDTFFMVDDIWFSAMLTKNGIPILHTQPCKNDHAEPVIISGHDLGRMEGSLMIASVDGMDRDDLNLRAVQEAANKYGIWKDALARIP